ncbi:fimbria/pilus periplasmic chaperone [Scandinavium sp. V105_16]|uniref:Fimbria/pilus periplasmic chaperone n=1 Tax=Scandinavium lactucae TaxID=3095028 RepID=A0AAJ2S8S9_9ENTR|nr:MULTISPECIES: fimbria/pilus periplasmic chaperone [unclassified Scandinavium]MDX6020477.1 fimbria/pilus periplasmic chaperone [Scandinavium sp. V105_16]MDX6031971.1 fimbria/pilus periplasmic chaperone [Scandinavium sp. V105_12]MDX6039831.1 fimbria/pilus periplasmic chaperone [Scandinavium sp. V105_6]MDX6051436.1 fimbria/pilus periplasmic chaperone [Scandinavium sp. V105_1]
MKIKPMTLWLSLAGTALLCSTITAHAAGAGGVALGATRMIYHEGQKETSISLSNTTKSGSFLIQSWIADANSKKINDFVLTPPLFVSKAKSENTLRLMYAGPALPKDRESVFYLHSRAIPSVDPKKVSGANVLQIAVESVIKVFWRPNGLNTTETQAETSLTCSRSGNQVTLKNPSPYYVSLVKLYSGTATLPNTMVPPKSSVTVKASGSGLGTVKYTAINDYGAASKQITCQGS